MNQTLQARELLNVFRLLEEILAGTKTGNTNTTDMPPLEDEEEAEKRQKGQGLQIMTQNK